MTGLTPARLAEHYLWQMICDHDAKTDVAVCSCGLWRSQPLPSVGEAAQAWAAHTLSVLAAAPPTDGAPPPRTEPGQVQRSEHILSDSREELREKVARIVDPDGWFKFDKVMRLADTMGQPRARTRLSVEHHVILSIAKADAILALVSAPLGEDFSNTSSDANAKVIDSGTTLEGAVCQDQEAS
jgi:hypothetical protein